MIICQLLLGKYFINYYTFSANYIHFKGGEENGSVEGIISFRT